MTYSCILVFAKTSLSPFKNTYKKSRLLHHSEDKRPPDFPRRSRAAPCHLIIAYLAPTTEQKSNCFGLGFIVRTQSTCCTKWFGTDIWSLSHQIEWTYEPLCLSSSNFSFLLKRCSSTLLQCFCLSFTSFSLSFLICVKGKTRKTFICRTLFLSLLFCVKIYLLLCHMCRLTGLNVLRKTSKRKKLLLLFNNTHKVRNIQRVRKGAWNAEAANSYTNTKQQQLRI